MNVRERILANPFVYRAFKWVVLPPGVRQSLVESEYTVADGGSVLDLGCGFGDFATYFADRCRYVGIDHNADYIAMARRRNEHLSGSFLVADVTDPVVRESGPFDLVMISGVLHHLDDKVVEELAANVASILKPGGQFVALEPVFDPSQRLTARLLIAADRGRFVRDAAGYEARLRDSFATVETHTVSGLLRIPYTHLVIRATA